MGDHTVAYLKNVTLRVRDQLLLPNTNWQIEKGQHWAILGPNGAGKSTLVRALTQDVAVVRGCISVLNDKSGRIHTGYVSFEQHQQLITREDHRDESRFFSGKIDQGTTAYDMLIDGDSELDCKIADADRFVNKLGIEPLLGKSLRALSNGEMRKVQIARVLINSPQILILDEPFDGLDPVTRRDLTHLINDLMDDSRAVIIVTHRQREILPNITHVLGVKNGEVVFQGERKDILTPSRVEHLYNCEFATSLTLPPQTKPASSAVRATNEVLVELQNVTVKYGDTIILDNVNWTMKSGENWVILGPNGSGKTTLLDVISGDNTQAYANEVYLFGRRRGSGESIWDIKERIGIISAEFQIRYRKPITAFGTVLSGFFDSVGLYRNATLMQRDNAERWMEILGIADLADRKFNRLSYGQQRMVLLARSMVKMPMVLILDEPYQGLDRANRRRILDAIDVIGNRSGTHIIYVTHYPDELPVCMTHMLRFEKAIAGTYAMSQCRI
ncbi:MAG: ATP-binding cassette domain-containing protein [Desulfobacterales bacterium]|jgi:molybdate transport system ATP-binding protein